MNLNIWLVDVGGLNFLIFNPKMMIPIDRTFCYYIHHRPWFLGVFNINGRRIVTLQTLSNQQEKSTKIMNTDD